MKIKKHISGFLSALLLFSGLFLATSCEFAGNSSETNATAARSDALSSEDRAPETALSPILTGDPISAKMVYPNDAKGAVSFVVDDGYQDTASIISDELLPKYEHLRISYGLIANSLAELDSDYAKDGIEDYFLSPNGDYEYFFTNQKNVNFWNDHVSKNNDYCEILSHSYTHSMWGNDDQGGAQQVQVSGGGYTTLTTARGAVTVELKGAQQIVRDLLGQSSNYFVMPGTGQVNSSYYLNLLQSGQYYRGARTTNKRINIRSEIKAPFSYIDAWMVTPSETADQWTSFIDTAVKNGNWACFCIHNILENSSAGWGHYIYQSSADQLFGHANQLAESGSLWIGTMSEVADYLQYWNASSVSALYDRQQNAIGVSVAADETVADYSVNATVKVALPDHWTNGAKSADGTSLKTKAENGVTYALVTVSSASPSVVLLPA